MTGLFKKELAQSVKKKKDNFLLSGHLGDSSRLIRNFYSTAHMSLIMKRPPTIHHDWNDHKTPQDNNLIGVRVAHFQK